ncbi:MAG TPA: Fe2+-dependent dioxygenase [Caulobacteraceae bacterium]|jgi:PKHD-type hydroxylase
MLIVIPEVLTKPQVAALRAVIDAAGWADGNATSGHQSALAKRNRQLPHDSQAARDGAATLLDVLSANPLFVAAALPHRVAPAMFSRYGPGDGFGLHVDGAVRVQPGTDFRLRADISATLFLSEPETYDGGELVIEDVYGEQRVKAAAGDLVLYPSSSLHRVEPLTRGERVSAVFWTQSLVRDPGDRRLLFELDQSIQTLTLDKGGADPTVITLTGLYHNLLRKWAEL